MQYSIKYNTIEELKSIAKVLRKLKFKSLNNTRLNFSFGYPGCNHWYTSNYVVCYISNIHKVVSAGTEVIGTEIKANELEEIVGSLFL